MKPGLKYPLQALFLLLAWLLLSQPFGWGDLLVGSIVAFIGTLTLGILGLPDSHCRRPWAMVRLVGFALLDVVRSNIAVGRIILSGSRADTTSGFLQMPLQLRAPYGLAILAVIITATPGTLWVSFNSASGMLTIHMLDLIGEDAWVETIHQRYEKLLLEVFE